MLGLSEARAFQKIEYRHRIGPIALAGLASGDQILAAFFRMSRKVLLAVALHEGELQRPPAKPDHRHPDQLLLEEELENRHAPVELVLQHEDVGPALVIAGHQVGMAHVYLLQPDNIPTGALHQIHPET